MFDKAEASRLAANLFKPFEDCKLTAYLCPAGVWTIGWGHTGPDVHPGLTWTQEQADESLIMDLQRFTDGVDALVVVDLEPEQAAALISLAYNIGLGALASSTLLKRVNERRHDQAALEFPRWNRSKGKVLNGLTRRRKAEATLYLSV